MPATGSRERSAICLEDTTGLMLHAIIHAADIQDRDGGLLLMSTPFGLDPFRNKLHVDGGYRRPEINEGVATACR